MPQETYQEWKRKREEQRQTSFQQWKAERPIPSEVAKPEPSGFLLSLLDKILIGQYISAGIAREMLKGGMLPEQIPAAAWRGIRERASYQEIAEQLGLPTKPLFREFVPPWLPTPSPAAIAGLAGDIFLDPVTYLGIGATKALWGKGAQEVAERFGIRFAGKAIPGLTVPKAGPTYQAALRALEAIRARPTLQALRGAFGAIGRPVGVVAEKWAKYLPMARAYRDIRRFRELEHLKSVMKIAKGVLPEERIAIQHALERPFIYTRSIKEIKELIPIRKEVWEQVSIKTMPWADRVQKLDQAIEQAVKQYDNIIKPVAEDLAKGARETAGLTKEFDLFRRIKELGGIAPSPTGAWKSEYRETVPLFLKNKAGQPLDDIAASLGMDVRELLEAIASRQRAGLINWRSFESEAAQLLEEAGHSGFLKASDRLFRLNELRDRLAEMAIARGPKISQERVQRFITEMVEQPRLIEIITKVPRLEPRLEARRKEIAEIYRRMVPEERVRGFYPRPVHRYAPHIKVEAKSPWLRFSKARTIEGTLEDVRQRYGIQIFEEDAYKALALRRIAHERAILTHDFVYNVLDDPDIARPFIKGARIGKDEMLVVPRAKLMFQPALREVPIREAKKALAKKLPKPPKAPDYTLGLDDFLEQINPEKVEQLSLLPGRPVAWIVPKGIVEHINKIGQRFIRDESTMAILQGYDRVLGVWKLWATAMRLPFHLRNFISNYWNNSLDLGVEAFDPKLNTLAWRVLRAGSLPKEQRLAQKIALGKKLWNLDELYQLSLEKGVVNTGWLGADIPYYLTAELNRLAQTGTERAFWAALPVSQQFIVARAMRNLGLNIENHARTLNFIGNLRKGLSIDDAVAHVKKFLFDYTELTPFEANALRRVVPFYCVSEDTECLTKKGWRKYDQIEIGEEILTYNLAKKSLEWKPTQNIFSADYRGHLFEFLGETIDILCTADHKFVTDKGLKEARDIGYNDRIPLNGDYQVSDYPIEDRLLSLIGWIATDGYARNKSTNSWEYVIYQKKEPYLSEIKNLLEPSNYSVSVHPQSGTSCLYIKNPLKNQIQRHYRSKEDLVPLVLRLSKRQLFTLKEIMFKAEGNLACKDSTKEFSHLAQEDLDIKTAFQLILLLTGGNSYLAQKGIYLKKKKVAKAFRPKVVWYEGKIWCPKTENETWIMRRSGKIIPTGNTWLRKNSALQLDYLLKKPGQYAALAKVPEFARYISQAPVEQLPDWAKDQFMIRTPWTNREGNPLFISPDLPPEDLEFFETIPGLSNDMKKAWSKHLLARLSPLIKVPLEWITNYNAFFASWRYPGRTVRAPWWVSRLPQALQERLGVTAEKGEKRIPAETAWLVQQLPPAYDIERFLGAIVEPTPRAPEYMTRYLTGLRIYGIPTKPVPGRSFAKWKEARSKERQKTYQEWKMQRVTPLTK